MNLNLNLVSIQKINSFMRWWISQIQLENYIARISPSLLFEINEFMKRIRANVGSCLKYKLILSSNSLLSSNSSIDSIKGKKGWNQLKVYPIYCAMNWNRTAHLTAQFAQWQVSRLNDSVLYARVKLKQFEFGGWGHLDPFGNIHRPWRITNKL